MTFTFNTKASADKFEKQLRKRFIIPVRDNAKQVSLYNVENLINPERIVHQAVNVYNLMENSQNDEPAYIKMATITKSIEEDPELVTLCIEEKECCVNAVDYLRDFTDNQVAALKAIAVKTRTPYSVETITYNIENSCSMFKVFKFYCY